MERFLSPRELFSPEEQRTHSFAAQRLYAGVWNKMARTQSNEVVICNKDLITSARIEVEKFEGVQAQLIRAGLLDITFDDRLGFVVEAKRTVYRLPAQQDAEPA